MEISILDISKSNLGPSNSDGSNTMDGSNLFESPANKLYLPLLLFALHDTNEGVLKIITVRVA
jgi:hypothetical protein